jgi:hypothetical protein
MLRSRRSEAQERRIGRGYGAIVVHSLLGRWRIGVRGGRFLVSAADRREAPTDDCSCKKQLGLAFLFPSISSKRDLNAISIRYFA